MTYIRSWRTTALLMVAVLGCTLLFVQRQAEAVPLTPAAPPSSSSSSWHLSVDGNELALASSCSGFGSSSEVIDYEFVDNDGRKGVSRMAGNTDATAVTCSFPVTSNRELYDWRAQVDSGDAALFERTLTFQRFTFEGAVAQRWRLANAWPSRYLQAFDRVVVVFVHEGATWLP